MALAQRTILFGTIILITLSTNQQPEQNKTDVTCKIMKQVFDEVTDDSVEGHYYDNSGQDHIKHMDGHMDGVSSWWDVGLKKRLILAWWLEIWRFKSTCHGVARVCGDQSDRSFTAVKCSANVKTGLFAYFTVKDSIR